MPGKIHVPVTVATDGFDKIQRQFGRLKGVAIGVTAALAGLGAAARALDFTGAAVKGARDLERNYAGLQSVFKDNTEQMKEFGRTASEMGLSMNEAAKATTFIGSVLKQSGFSIAETANLTEELVELGADLALTYGYDVQEALLGMTALFRGEYDPIEKFGVAMKQSEIDAEKAARGLDGLTGAAERFADQQIRVEFLMERAADAMGAFDRQSGNLTVQQMRLRAEFENIRDTIADDLLPPLADFTGGLRFIAKDVGPELEDQFDRLAPILSELGDDAIAGLQLAIEGVLSVSDLFLGFFEEATTEGSNLNTSLGNLGTQVSELAGNITDNLPSMEENVDGLAVVVGTLADAVARLADNIDRSATPILDFFNSLNVAGQVATATGIGALALSIKKVRTQLVKLATFLRGHPLILAFLGITEGVGFVSRVFEDNAEFAEKYERALSTVSEQTRSLLSDEENLQVQYLATLAARGELEEMMQDSEIAKMAEKFGFATDGVMTFNGSLNELEREGLEGLISNPAPSFLDDLAENFRVTGDAAFQVNEQVAVLLEGMSALEKFQAVMVPENIDPKTGRAFFGVSQEGIDAYEEYKKSLKEDAEKGGPANVAKDFVGDFFDGIAEGIRKESARLELEGLGLTDALINQILSSQGFEEIFEEITDGGREMARQLQDDFNKTAAGIKEAADRAKELQNLLDKEKALELDIEAEEDRRDEALASAREKFDDFTKSLNLTADALNTYEREIGRFESQTRSDLQRIENQINSAFDNDYLLEEAKDNLLEYARAELNTLMQLQRQRDELLRERDAAASTIFGVAQAVTAAGNITGLLQNVQDSVEEVQVKELFEDVVDSADGLNGFKVTLERNYTDVVTKTVNKSQALVNNFQAVIDRTKNFIANLKELRELGLDPFLFNQLVEAGAEAGGATAQALVDGGVETVNEVNSLQSELEALGTELGEETYEVTKNSGEQFVSGLVDGMDAELESLGEMAKTMALDFTKTFEILFRAGTKDAFEGILDEIRDEYKALIAELKAELAKVKNDIADVQQEARVATGESIIVEGVEVVEGSSSIGPDNIGDLPQSEQDFIREAFPEMFGNTNAMAAGGGGGAQNVNVYNVNANNPLDAYNASKGNVEQQSTYQSSNGDIAVTLAGVGN